MRCIARHYFAWQSEIKSLVRGRRPPLPRPGPVFDTVGNQTSAAAAPYRRERAHLPVEDTMPIALSPSPSVAWTAPVGPSSSARPARGGGVPIPAAALPLSPVVAVVGSLRFEGNLIPQSWYRHSLLQHESGKANLVAITVLAEIVYWYRPAGGREAAAGAMPAPLRNKFAADKLHLSYAALAEKFGLTKRQVQEAVAFLKERGVITVELRDVCTRDGITLRNLVYVEPVPATIYALSSAAGTAEAARSQVAPPVPVVVEARVSGRPDTPPAGRATAPASRSHVPHSTVPRPTSKRDCTKSTAEASFQEITKDTAATAPAASEDGADRKAFSAAAGGGGGEALPPERIADALAEAGVNRRDACRIAQENPDECRRQIAFLPYAPVFKSSQGAYLRSAIEQGFAPPSGWLLAQEATLKAQRQQARQAERKNEETRQRAERERLQEQKTRLKAERPDLWAAIRQEAEAQIPPPLKSRPDGPAYQAALEARINQLLPQADALG